VRLVSYSSELVNINAFWNSNALDGSTIDLMTIVVKAATVNAITTLPASPASFNPFQEAQAVRTRTFELYMGFSAPMKINGVSMDMNRIDQTVHLDDTEIWEITNNSDMPHPFHIHDIQFLILTRDGWITAARE